MTTPHHPHHDAEQHVCTGVMCDVATPGHALSIIQQRVATATASKWRDAVVDSVSADGWVQLTTIDDRETVWVWNHRDLSSVLGAGEPVALHAVYHVLAIGGTWVNVASLAPAAATQLA
ncbi:hypothetical protein [Galbitalea soli]|uniref:Uncharacterized protein n=1 Tax=Galbitalea soli TaxID=1268042 RepID=A0A7C9PP03_9MICO|nr:hypothetical protein [Galbitalea soli]NEM91947.1 hypothetical protein [Galbitalea soli]NYJ32105.1 hypothetical protein [Galbitalea soli]